MIVCFCIPYIFFDADSKVENRDSMEEFGCLWSYHENIDEVKQKLIYTTLELETIKIEANEEIRKNKENMRNLHNLLKIAYQERDEARDQLQNLLNKLMASSPTELPNIHPRVHPESPLVIPAKANSSITESNSLSETYNPQSHGSSPVDSLFDAVSSPDFSNINVVDSGKALPQKGELLQAVMEAGPLLQTLIVAGPLPRWRNPPPLQPFKIPPFSIKGCETADFSSKSPANAGYMVQKPLNSSTYPVMSRGTSQTCSAAMLNFASGPSNSYSNNMMPLTTIASFNNHVPAGKRQRFQ
ncbi:hypothetical protein CMV_002586 [Castanea mollissima]|uniref:Uncharacterized protein n=1 Tax=Castanea mollissima TaxID=60419 RepID=A0A8J4S1L1_9ROSI|nr:hypothetical protein CMV_002586 [Castanea mollissima]